MRISPPRGHYIGVNKTYGLAASLIAVALCGAQTKPTPDEIAASVGQPDAAAIVAPKISGETTRCMVNGCWEWPSVPGSIAKTTVLRGANLQFVGSVRALLPNGFLASVQRGSLAVLAPTYACPAATCLTFNFAVTTSARPITLIFTTTNGSVLPNYAMNFDNQ